MALSPKQQKYKKNRLMGMNQHNAAIAAGYSYSTARRASVIDKSAKVSLSDAFERAGLTDKKLIEHALEGLFAEKKCISAGVYVTDDKDWIARHKYFESICKLTERLKDPKSIEQENLSIKVYNIILERTGKNKREGLMSQQRDTIDITDSSTATSTLLVVE